MMTNIFPTQQSKALPKNPLFGRKFLICIVVLCITIVFVVGGLLFLEAISQNNQTKIENAQLVQSAQFKQLTPVVAGQTKKIDWTVLILQSSITSDRHYIKLPKDAENIQIKTISPAEADKILSDTTPKNPSANLTTSDRLALAKLVRNDFIGSMNSYLLAGLEEAVGQLASIPIGLLKNKSNNGNAITIPTQDSLAVDLSDEKPKDKSDEKNNPQNSQNDNSQGNENSKDKPKQGGGGAPRQSSSWGENFIQVSYQTKAPAITEKKKRSGKEVTVSIPNEVVATSNLQIKQNNVKSKDKKNQPGEIVEAVEAPSVTNVLAHATLPKLFKVGQDSKIQIRWKNNDNKIVDFKSYDLDTDGYIDYIEWSVPHLSDQIFDIIYISRAWLLDANQNITAEVYDQVKVQDNVWVNVPTSNYIRVTFTKPLDSSNDITVYAKPNSGYNSSIEVYPVYLGQDGNLTEGEKIANFPTMVREDVYKVALSGLQTPTDQFDLKIVNGSIDLDWIVDPSWTWIRRTNGVSTGYWYGLASSSDGSKLAAVRAGTSVFTSADYGGTWTEHAVTGAGGSLISVASSADGTKLIVVDSNAGGYVYTSTDSGATWSQRTGAGAKRWRAAASSSDGTKLVVVSDNAMATEYISTSTDSGANWSQRTGAGKRNWMAVASSADGTKLAAVVNGGNVYTSVDSGANWTERIVTGSGVTNWLAIASSADGTKLAIAGNTPSYIWTSTNSGANWTQRTTSGSRTWMSISSSADGTKLIACAGTSSNDNVYTSVDSGANWTQQAGAGSAQWYATASSDDGYNVVAGGANFGSIYSGFYNGAPSFSAGPSDGGSSSTNQTTAGNNITFTATATDAESNNYYLAVCKTNSITANNGAAPTCGGGNWCISGSTASGSEASCNYTTQLTDNGDQTWYAFICDISGSSLCSAVSQGTGDNGSPFSVLGNVNPPAFTSGPSDGGQSVLAGNTVTFSAVASDDNSDNYYLAICKTNAITANNNAAPTCGGGNWCISNSTTSGSQATCDYATTTNDGGNQDWYAFICDHNDASLCSASSQGTGDNASPFEVIVDNTPPVLSNFNYPDGSTLSVPVNLVLNFNLSENGDCRASRSNLTFDQMTGNNLVSCTGAGTTSAACNFGEITTNLGDITNGVKLDFYVACEDSYSNKSDTTHLQYTPLLNRGGGGGNGNHDNEGGNGNHGNGNNGDNGNHGEGNNGDNGNHGEGNNGNHNGQGNQQNVPQPIIEQLQAIIEKIKQFISNLIKK
jgi:hypothetical protein